MCRAERSDLPASRAKKTLFLLVILLAGRQARLLLGTWRRVQLQPLGVRLAAGKLRQTLALAPTS